MSTAPRDRCVVDAVRTPAGRRTGRRSRATLCAGAGQGLDLVLER